MQFAFNSWSKVPFKDGPYFETPMSQIARGKFASLSKTVSGTFKIDEMEFYHMDDQDWSHNKWYNHIYRQQQPDSKEEIGAERHWGFFGTRTSAFLANVSFTRAKDNQQLTCAALGLPKMIRGETYKANYLFIRYDVTIIKHPFKYVAINDWVEDPNRNNLEHWIFIDPDCCAFDGGENEVAKFTTAIDDILMNEKLRHWLIEYMRKFYIRWIIEPNRFVLTGLKRLPNSEEV